MDNENSEMKKKIRKKVIEIQTDLIKAIKELVSIYSIQTKREKNAPYGEGPKKALEKALEINENLGFCVRNIDNRVGYAQYKGDGALSSENRKNDDYIGIFGHVDVVPVGKGWKYNPLEVAIEKNRMYGRGVLDNKGPILSNLFALYALKECGIKFKIPVRIVFGTNEESGFKCVKHYLKKERPPVFGWTPDCKWPVVYGEMGRLKVRLLCEDKNVKKIYDFINEFILSGLNKGVKLGIDFKDDDFGEVSLKGYRLGVTNKSIKSGSDMENTEKNALRKKNIKLRKHFFEFTVSYPGVCTKDKIMELIREKMPEKIEMEVISNWDPVLYNKNSEYVRILQNIYNEVTGLNSRPVTTTGGTYAKIVPNIIAFGPSYPNQKNIAHLPNEWIDLDDLQRNTEIYALSLYELSKVIKSNHNFNI